MVNIINQAVNKPIKKCLVLITAVVLVFCATFGTSDTSHAASAAGFNPGYIIDDSVMTNSGSMSISQIQGFLNSKVPNCDTNHAGFYGSSGTWYGPPFTCLKDYTENGLSSAQIIYNAAQQYHINPQVLIVLLQKEQGLITDTWPAPYQYTSATGYGCPDSTPGVCNSAYYGFTNQVNNAAKLFHSVVTSSPNWYSPYVLGNNYIQWSPNASCGGSTVNIQNLSTAALYDYTPYRPNQASLNAGYGTGDSCSSYGNRNFYLYFSDWFGPPSSPPPTKCDSRVEGVVCVWSVRKSDGSQFLTSSETELSNTMYIYGWTNEGIIFYASDTDGSGATPIHRLLNDNQHYYTADYSEYNSLKNTGNWVDEGIPFYVYPSDTTTNSSHVTYKLYSPTLDRNYWTTSKDKVTILENMGYSSKSTPFNTPSGLADLSTPAAGRINIYRLAENSGYFYTTSLYELESVIKRGYPYEGILTTSNTSNAGTAVYRLQRGSRHFYTTNTSERDIAISRYGYVDEGVGFYVDSNSDQIYRLANTRYNIYLYTSSFAEVMLLVNAGGWTYEGTLINVNNTDPSPIYRFLNILNSRHFYTIDINEAIRISNRGWKYETIAFYANKDSGLPVYRLLSYDKHFYTTNVNEKDIAINKYGYIYEGIAFYVSQNITNKPTYRLQGGNDEYFYTSSSTERDTAVSRYGYQYEGEGFYLPSED
jgi:hypothetical protein